MEKLKDTTFFTIILALISKKSFGFQPCPKGTSPDKLYTYPPSILILLAGIALIFIFEKKIKGSRIKLFLQILTGGFAIVLSFGVFSSIYVTAPCR